MHCRIFAHESADGPANMALDEALLDAVAEDPSFALLRTYGWTEPTLSLGYFQAIAAAEGDPRWRGVPIVRRPTGGGAIWHHHELTYALVLPAVHPLARPANALYHAVHSALVALLRSHGVDASLRGVGARSGADRRPFLCFADRAPEDIVCHDAKVVGSEAPPLWSDPRAWFHAVTAVFVHTGILWTGGPFDSDCGYPVLGGACGADIRRALGLIPDFAEIPAVLRQRASDREREVYRNDAWNRRR